MNANDLRELLREIKEIKRLAVRHRRGEITDIDPLTVALGGAETPQAGVRSLAGDLVVGDQVSVLVFGKDMLIVGRITPVPRCVGGTVNGSNGAKLRGRGFTSARTGAGTYAIAFTPALADSPTPTFGLHGNGFTMNINIASASTTALVVTTYRSDTGAATDCTFGFAVNE